MLAQQNDWTIANAARLCSWRADRDVLDDLLAFAEDLRTLPAVETYGGSVLSVQAMAALHVVS